MIEKGFIKEMDQSWYYESYKPEPQILQHPGSPEHKTNPIKNTDYPTIILLHEGLGSVAQWKNWPVLLHERTKMNVLAYDRTGYGKSSVAPINYPFDYLRYEAKYILPKILDHLLIDSAYLFGHSDGGTIALLAAAYYPGRIKSVISEAAHVIIESISIEGIRETKKNYHEKLKRPLNKYHSQKTDWVFYHWADTWLKPEFFDWNMTEELQKIQCPVLAIQGKDDEYGSYEQLKIIQENCHSKLVHLNDCGHHPHFEQAEKILFETKEFLDNVNRF